MRIYFLVLLTGLSTLGLFANETTRDSLLLRSKETTAGKEALAVLANSMDFSRGQEHVQWAKKLFEEAVRVKDEYYMEESVTELLRYYVNNDIKDTANYYLEEADRLLKDKQYKDYLLTFMGTIMDVRVFYYQKNAEGDSLVTQALLRIRSNKDTTPLKRVSDYYLLGMAAGVRAETDYEGKGKDVVGYFKQVLKETEDLPLRIGMLFRPNSFHMICGILPDAKDRVEYSLQYLDLLTKNQNYLRTKGRTTMSSQRHWLNAYGMLASSSEALPKAEAEKYYQKFVELNHKYPEDANFTPQYEYCYTSINYYKGLHDYKKALPVCDSIIAILKDLGYEEHSIQYWKEKVGLCDSLHLYKEGFEAYKYYDELQQRVLKTNQAAEAKEMDMVQQVDQLIIEKKTLEVENRQMLNYLLLALFLLAIGTVGYAIVYLRKSKDMNRKLQEANNKLVETSEQLKVSEKMRYAFIRNMCSEIYTPLNAIKGFSDILMDDNMGGEEKKTFLSIISENSSEVNKMMDNILEIVRLGSSNEPLPVDLTNLHTLCTHELERVKQDAGKPDINYHVKGDKENDVVATNQTYFRYVLGHLLTNISKLMNEGSIMVAYQLKKETGTALVYITANSRTTDLKALKGNDETNLAEVAFFVCEMIAERMNAKLYKDVEFADGLRFIFELPL